MNSQKKQYKYRVEGIRRGKWVCLCHTDIEDKDTFRFVANAEEYQYRVLCDGEDVTYKYKK